MSQFLLFFPSSCNSAVWHVISSRQPQPSSFSWSFSWRSTSPCQCHPLYCRSGGWWGGRRYWWMMLFDWELNFFAVYLPVFASLELIWLNHDRICWFTCWHDIILVTSSYHRNSLFQCIGAVLGAGILLGCTPTPVSDTLGANGLSSINVSGGGLVSVTPEAGHHCDSISSEFHHQVLFLRHCWPCSWSSLFMQLLLIIRSQ